MIEILDRSTGSIVGIRVTGKVTQEDYERMVPQLQSAIDSHGELNLFCRFDGFDGIEPGAVWEDFQFYVSNIRDFGRCAVVQDQEWQGRLARLGPLFGIETRVFEATEEEEAWQWLVSEVEAAKTAAHEERDARRVHAAEKRLHRLVTDLRADIPRLEDPRAKALMETSAEALEGLRTAFEHYREGAEAAFA